MKRNLFIAILAAVFILVTGKDALFAQRGGRAGETMEVKIASPLPKESPWGRTLDRIASEWSRVTNSQVRMRVLHGGTEGSEGKMYLSLASNSIQAAVFTSFGLSTITPAVMTMSAPFLIRTEDELNAVMNEVEKDLEDKINSGDFLMVAWSRAGFVNVFSKDPVYSPDDLKKMKIASNAEADDMNTAFKTMGFQIVDSDLLDLAPKLASGAISAVYQSPAGVAAYQMHNFMKNMLSINIAPVLGGIVVNQVTWRRIGELNPRYQTELLRATRRIAEDFDETMRKTLNDAINTMVREGLKVNRPSAAQEQLWFSEIDRVTPTLLGTTYDRDLYRKINEVLSRYRGGR